jgi:adenylate kinase
MLRDVTKKSIGFIFGPNGVGKGTLADVISEKFQYVHYSMGVVVRDYALERGHEQVKELVNNGILVDDEIIREALHEKVDHLRYDNIVFDGVPRKLSQVEFMQEICEKHNFSAEWVIVLSAPLDVLIERLSERVMGPDGKVYHLRYSPPPAHIKPEELTTRPDDRPEVIKKRYEDYMALTLECLSHPFFLEIPTISINATQSIERVCDEGVQFVSDIYEG